MSINRVVVSGNLTRDPEIRAAASGMNILTFGMAVNDRRRNPQTQEWEDYANFVDCVMFGNRADYMYRTLHKGIRVVVEGKLRYSSWERDGQRRSKLEVVVDDIDFVSPRQSQGQGGYTPQNPQQNGGYQSQQPGGYQQGGGYQTQQGGYQSQQSGGYQQSYPQGPSYSAPAPTQPAQMTGSQQNQQANQDYGVSHPQVTPTQSAPQADVRPQQDVSVSTPAPAPSPSGSGSSVTAPPETDMYDEDIPF